MGWAGEGWTEGDSRLSLALRIQNLMKTHRHTLASIDPCTQIHTPLPTHPLTCWFSHTLTCACVCTTHRQAHSLHTPTRPYTHHSIHSVSPHHNCSHTHPHRGFLTTRTPHSITHMPLNTFLHTYTPSHPHVYPPLPTIVHTQPCTHILMHTCDLQLDSHSWPARHLPFPADSG